MTDTTLPVPLPDRDISPEFSTLWGLICAWEQSARGTRNATCAALAVDTQVHAMLEAYARACMAPLQENNAKLKTVMIAAAEEIAAHWAGHCDAEGYGPVNLLHRLEEGIPSEYGYTAGAFKALQERADALQAELNSIADTLPGVHYMDPPDGGAPTLVEQFKRMAKDAKRADALQAENDTLRGLLGNSAKPCTYCGLAAEDQGKCQYGFPGCMRADDQMLSKHFADGYWAEQAQKRADALEAALRELVDLKALKSRMERSLAASMARGNNPSEQYHAWKNEYNLRKPLAWANARSLINPTGGESS